MMNHARPAAVITIATKKLSRSPRKYAEESTLIDSSNIWYPESARALVAWQADYHRRSHASGPPDGRSWVRSQVHRCDRGTPASTWSTCLPQPR
jgi:hypothetical protein